MWSVRTTRSARVIVNRLCRGCLSTPRPLPLLHDACPISTLSRVNPALLHQPSSLLSWNHVHSWHNSAVSQSAHICTAASSPVQPSALQEASGRDLVLSPPALVVTREYEWANILVGFEQANKYTIRAAPGGNVVGYLAEEESLGRSITRNVLRTHRPFKATVFDTHRNPLFIIRRPMYLISTSIFVETPEGEVLGEVHMNWHLWRRRYSLYVEKAQFASVDSGFLAVDFDMRDVDNKKIASVNKDFTGFVREIFTDARQYVLRLDPRYGIAHDGELIKDAATVDLQQEEYGEMKMGLRERAVILAAAICIDFDYFSVHSRGHGMHPGFMPMPIPGGGGGGAAGGAAGSTAANAGTVAGADILSDNIGGAEEQGGLSEDPYGNPINEQDPFASPDSEGPPADDQQEWATFEEPDHGFSDPPADDEWSESEDPWGSDNGSDDGDGGGGIFEIVKGVFFDDD